MAESRQRQTIEDKARALCEGLVAGEGLELLDVEFVREPQVGFVLRLFIDNPNGTVGVEECQKASRAVDLALDVDDFIPHEYSLEVSSPGVNRPLKKVEHYQRVLGKKVRVKTFGPVGEPPRKNFVGTLTDVKPDLIAVSVDGAGAFTIPLKDIARANLEFEF
jgi:ribosome maturation factor RimP